MLVDRQNPDTASRTEIWRDTETGLPIIRRAQEIRPILDANARDAGDFDRARIARNPMGARHVARIPFVVWGQLREAGIVQGNTVVDVKRFLAFLSDPDVRKLRCDNGARLG